MIFLLSVKIYSKIKERQQEKREREKAEREEMLRILPQLELLEFKRIVEEKLGWVKKDTYCKNVWNLHLPTRDFASVDLLGLTFGSIFQNWTNFWQGDDSKAHLEIFVRQLLGTFTGEEISQFVSGVAKSSDDVSLVLENEITILRSEREKGFDRQERCEIVERGLKASGIKE